MNRYLNYNHRPRRLLALIEKQPATPKAIDKTSPYGGIPKPDVSGIGFLAGSYPDGVTTVEGAPVPATVRVLLRVGYGQPGDGSVVAQVESAQDGTWRVEGLNPNLRYDVVGRKDGFNDVIMANVTPATM